MWYYVIGNPGLYRGKTAVWTKVHRLASLGNVSFEYDYAGIRTKKTVNGITTKYGINGSTIVSEQKGADATTRINYYYGHDGVTGFKYLGNCYYYKKNFLGDIIGIYNESDDLVAKYFYDAWGNHKVLNPNGTENTTATFIGNINPFRYRSYYFDTETGLYYLQSRYYDSEIGRFISMDQVEYLAPDVVNGLNLYVYCLNNPVMGYDPDGTWNWKKFWKGVGLVATAVVAVAVSVVTFGAGTPVAMAVVAGVTLAAGVLTGVNGVATIVEAGTDYNFVRDGVFNEVLGLSDETYDNYETVVENIANIGIVICGGYQQTGRFKASKYGRKFLGKGYTKAGYTKAGTPRYVSKDGLRQMRVDKPHMRNGKMLGKHINLEQFNGTKPIPYEHVLYDLFDYWTIK